MQRVQPVCVLCAAIISTTLMLAVPALAGENKFVFVPHADSPGNDYLKVDNSSFEECERKCDAQSECNAFTYNQLDSVCFLKLAANRVTTFHALANTGVKLSPSVRPTASATGSGPSFVILSQVDSPGNDYSRIDHFSFEDCRSSCEADDGCNAFTYNHARGVCFLKRAANQWTTFFAWASTGIKLSSLKPQEKTTAPAEQGEAPEPPSPPAESEIAAPPEQAQSTTPPASAAESEGKAILEKNCGRCHSLEASSESPLPQAPPLREVYLKYPIDQLEEGFAEGMGSKHRDMPQIQFSPGQVGAILNYLGSITGVDPATRTRAVIPGETPP